MPIFSMAFGAAKTDENGKKVVHFRAAFTKQAETCEDADRVASLQCYTYYPPAEGWAQHTLDVHAIPVSWCVEVARSEFNLAHVQDRVLQGARTKEQRERILDLFKDFIRQLHDILGEPPECLIHFETPTEGN